MLRTMLCLSCLHTARMYNPSTYKGLLEVVNTSRTTSATRKDFHHDNINICLPGSERNDFDPKNRSFAHPAASNRYFHRETSNIHAHMSENCAYKYHGQKYYNTDGRTSFKHIGDKMCVIMVCKDLVQIFNRW